MKRDKLFQMRIESEVLDRLDQLRGVDSRAMYIRKLIMGIVTGETTMTRNDYPKVELAPIPDDNEPEEVAVSAAESKKPIRDLVSKQLEAEFEGWDKKGDKEKERLKLKATNMGYNVNVYEHSAHGPSGSFRF